VSERPTSPRNVAAAEEPVVYVVDDDASVRDALENLFRSVGLRVQVFGSAPEFLQSKLPDVASCLILDIRLPRLSGLDFQVDLAEAGINIPIIFMTGHGDIPMSVRAIKAGAADFLTKPVHADALNEAIRAAIEQHAVLAQNRSDSAAIRLRLKTLTPREREVLTAVVAGKLNKQIAFELGIVEQTVKYHRARIMERMQAKSSAELMHLVARVQDE
jgi:FixJ family two-component response regulator